MNLRPSGYSGINTALNTSNNYAKFVTADNSSVTSVLCKSKAFGFRDVDVVLGYRIQFTSTRPECNLLVHPSGKHFLFREVDERLLVKRKVEVIGSFFRSATLELFKENERSEQPPPMELIKQAFEYDIFIMEKAKELHHRETLPAFLERQGDSGLQHLHFLGKIADAMLAKPEFDSEHDGQYLLSLWIDLSNAMAFNVLEKTGRPTPVPLAWDTMTNSSPNKRQPANKNQGRPAGENIVQSEEEQTTPPTYRQNSINQEEMLNYNPYDKHSGMPSLVEEDGSASLYLGFGRGELARRETNKKPQEENFLDKAKREGKSEAEIAVLKFNFLMEQVTNNAYIIQRSKETGGPWISEIEKTEMMRKVLKVQSIINDTQIKK